MRSVLSRAEIRGRLSEGKGSFAFSTFTETEFAAEFVLAAEAGRLVQLSKLYLQGTSCSDISLNSIVLAAQNGGLRNLKWLYLSYTRISDVGFKALMEIVSTGCLPSLQGIQLSGTQITNLGVLALAQTAKNRRLLSFLGLDLSFTSVSDSGLQELASIKSQGHLPKLQWLDLRRTGVTTVGKEVLETLDARAILESMLIGVSLPIGRVLVIGMGDVGKTWLRRRCFQDELIHPKELREETHDIDLIAPEQSGWRPEWTTLDNRHNVDLWVWDFGGQMVLHGVHEAFMEDDGRTVFLLVASAGKPPERRLELGCEVGNGIEYWLRVIEHFAGNEVPVVVAITQCDKWQNTDRPVDGHFLGKPFSEWSAPELSKFGAKVAAIVDGQSACSQDANINNLRIAIATALLKRSGIVKGRVPPAFPSLRTMIDNKMGNRTLVPLTEYRAWCKEKAKNTLKGKESSLHTLLAQDRQDVYLRILHLLGCVIHEGPSSREPKELDLLPPGQKRRHSQNMPSVLSEYVANPNWLKYAIYSIFRLSERPERKGGPRLSKLEISRQIELACKEWVRERRISSFSRHKEELEYVLAFLTRIGLTYFDSRDQKFLFPRGLDEGYPDNIENWPSATLLWEFLPETSFHRFLVRRLEYGEVMASGSSRKHWRYAVQLSVEKVVVAVVADEVMGKIEVRFDPESALDNRLKIFDYVKRDFEMEFVGKAAKGVQPPESRMQPAENAKEKGTLTEDEIYSQYISWRESVSKNTPTFLGMRANPQWGFSDEPHSIADFKLFIDNMRKRHKMQKRKNKR